MSSGFGEGVGLAVGEGGAWPCGGGAFEGAPTRGGGNPIFGGIKPGMTAIFLMPPGAGPAPVGEGPGPPGLDGPGPPGLGPGAAPGPPGTTPPR